LREYSFVYPIRHLVADIPLKVIDTIHGLFPANFYAKG